MVTPRTRAIKAIKDFISATIEVDKDVIYSENEPAWWLKMMELQRMSIEALKDKSLTP